MGFEAGSFPPLESRQVPELVTLEPWPLRLQAEGEGLEADTQILVTDKA